MARTAQNIGSDPWAAIAALGPIPRKNWPATACRAAHAPGFRIELTRDRLRETDKSHWDAKQRRHADGRRIASRTTHGPVWLVLDRAHNDTL